MKFNLDEIIDKTFIVFNNMFYAIVLAIIIDAALIVGAIVGAIVGIAFLIKMFIKWIIKITKTKNIPVVEKVSESELKELKHNVVTEALKYSDGINKLILINEIHDSIVYPESYYHDADLRVVINMYVNKIIVWAIEHVNPDDPIHLVNGSVKMDIVLTKYNTKEFIETVIENTNILINDVDKHRYKKALIFHGACHDCQVPITGTIRDCFGCQWANKNSTINMYNNKK